jgi:hypothetical protein
VFRSSTSAIPRNQYQLVTSRGGGNPDVVFGKRPALLLQALFQDSVLPSDVKVARNDGSAGCESPYNRCIFRRATGLCGSEEQFTERDRRYEYFGRSIEIRQHRVISLE